jgi:glycogen debranching enzyme
MASDEAIRQAAEQLLRRNLRRGVSPFDGVPYCYSAPSPATYPHQFFWDSCFHAIVWAHFDPEQAKEELRSLLRAQDADGRIPHRIAWDRRGVLPRAVSRRWRAALHPMRSQLVGPPVLATAIERVYERCGDASFLAEALPAADRFYSWLARCRDPDGDGLVSIIHPYESGLDHKPSYDAVFGLRRAPATAAVLAAKAVDGWNRLLNFNRSLIFRLDRFNVVDVGFNCIYAQALASLARLWTELGDHAKAEAWREQARRVEQAILSKCLHDDGLYYDLYSRKQKKALTKTVTCLFPLLLDSIEPAPAERLVREHLLDGDAFWLPYPVPTVSASEAAFSPGFVSSFASGLWRGPTCIAANWFIVLGLRKHGFADVAGTIVERTRQLVERGGFRECYNPLTGQPYGAESFGWSTLIVDMLDGPG